jgi:general secretion pathway protein E
MATTSRNRRSPAAKKTTADKKRSAPPAAPPAAPADLLDMDQAISALATTRPTFYRWLRAGTVKGVKIGRQWRFRREDIERFLRGEGPRVDLPADIRPLITTLRERLGETGTVPTGDHLALAAALMLQTALHLDASDLHLLAMMETGTMQVRVDGALMGIATFDVRLQPLVVETLKRMAAMDTAVTDMPQDGRIRLRSGGRQIDVYLTTVPTSHGECLVARFADQSRTLPALDDLRFAAREKALVLQALQAPSGMVLFTGPTGSGKTTALYVCAQHASSPDARLVSVETHPAFNLPGAVRVRVDPRRNMSYPAVLRAVMRMDPDLVAIDDLHDHETMEVAVECAVTGHLVLANLHAPDAIGALRQIAELATGIPGALDELHCIVAQRLLRRVCADCAVAGNPPAALARQAERVAGSGGVMWSSLSPAWKRAVGCPACNDSGFRGRFMVVEALAVTRDLLTALRRGAGDGELRSIALGQGFATMTADGVRKAAEGVTTLDEVARLLPDWAGTA